MTKVDPVTFCKHKTTTIFRIFSWIKLVTLYCHAIFWRPERKSQLKTMPIFFSFQKGSLLIFIFLKVELMVVVFLACSWNDQSLPRDSQKFGPKAGATGHATLSGDLSCLFATLTMNPKL